GKVQRVSGFSPVAKHHRHRRKYLHRNAVAIAFPDSPRRIPHVVGDLPKNAVADHHASTTRLIMIKPDESAVTVFRVEVRPVPRPLWRVRHSWWDKECFTFPDNVVHDAVAFAHAHLHVAVQLLDILLRNNEVTIVPRVGPSDHHDEKLTAVLAILVAYPRFQF